MSVYLYDEAIIDNLRRITQRGNIYITPADNVFRTTGALNNDNIRFPMISLTRTDWSIAPVTHAMKFTGASVSYNEDSNHVKSKQLLPIRINYLLDVWTQTRKENDDIMRELIWLFSTHPTMRVTIPYGLDLEHNFNIYLDNDVTDNSDIVAHPDRGEYFRQTISLYTDDAYLWKAAYDYPSYIGSIEYEGYSNKELIDKETFIIYDDESGD